MRNTVIIGSGPAALSAAIYAARAGLEPLVVASSIEPGGALTTTTDVDNYPGFDEGIMGPELMEKMEKQARRFGAEILYDDAESLELTGEVKRIKLMGGDTVETKTVIYATGSAYRKLGLPKEEELTGRGVSNCATCDGFFFREQEIAVVGGGDTAMEEAIFLTKFASKVHVIHRKDTLRASKAVADSALANEKIEFIWDTEVEEILGEDDVEGLIIKNVKTGETKELPVTGLFVAIGSDPRIHLTHGQLDLTPQGTIAIEGRSSKTTAPGVFAAGDVIDPVYKQAGIASGSGIVAALDVEAFLEAQKR